MSQTPLKDMADTGYENMSEEAGYILHELKLQMRAMSRRIEAAATKSEVQSVWKSAERQFAEKQVCHAALNKLALDQDLHKAYTVEVEITAAELLALNAEPKKLVAAPQANCFIDIVSAQLYLPFNTTPYTIGANNDLSLGYSGGDQLVTFEGTGLLDQSSDQRRAYHHPATPMNVNAGQAIELKMLDSEITLGDSPLKIKVCYRIEELI